MQSETSSVDTTSQMRIQTSMTAVERLSKVWVAAKIVYARFETILCDNGFWRNSQGSLELVKRRHSTENTTNRSASRQYGLTAADYGSNQTMSLQFNDRLHQVLTDLATGLSVQNDSTSTSAASLAFQTMNPLSLAGSASYNTSNPPQNSLYTASISLDMSLPESHEPDKRYDFRHIFPQGIYNTIRSPRIMNIN